MRCRTVWAFVLLCSCSAALRKKKESAALVRRRATQSGPRDHAKVAAPHNFQNVGPFRILKELEAKSHDGLVRVAMKVDLVQRPRGGPMVLRDFSRRALLPEAIDQGQIGPPRASSAGVL